MDGIELKLHAEFLENEIRENLGKSKDVDWLAQYPPLLTELQDAKLDRVDKPRDIGLGRWELIKYSRLRRSIPSARPI